MPETSKKPEKKQKVELAGPPTRLNSGASTEPFWVVGDYKYYEWRRVLEKAGTLKKLRPKLHALFLLFLKSNHEPLMNEDLLVKLWGPGPRRSGTEDVHRLKSDLNKFLGTKDYIQNVRGGYQLIVDAVRYATPPAAHLEIFPGASTVFGPSYWHSWVGHGANDRVKFLQEKANYESKPRQMILLSPDRRPALMIPFEHSVLKHLARHSWWSAAIALSVDPLSGEWNPIAINSYSKLLVEARGVPSSRKDDMRKLPLKVRFEDDSVRPGGGSFRQSSDWHPSDILVGPRFQLFEIDLEEFDWLQDAWPTNTGPVDKQRIVQVVFGQDDSIPSCTGTVEIRRLRLLGKPAHE